MLSRHLRSWLLLSVLLIVSGDATAKDCLDGDNYELLKKYFASTTRNEDVQKVKQCLKKVIRMPNKIEIELRQLNGDSALSDFDYRKEDKEYISILTYAGNTQLPLGRVYLFFPSRHISFQDFENSANDIASAMLSVNNLTIEYARKKDSRQQFLLSAPIGAKKFVVLTQAASEFPIPDPNGVHAFTISMDNQQPAIYEWQGLKLKQSERYVAPPLYITGKVQGKEERLEIVVTDHIMLFYPADGRHELKNICMGAY